MIGGSSRSLSSEKWKNIKYRLLPLLKGGRDISSPAIWVTKISAHFGDNNFAQMSHQICSHTPSALNAGTKQSDVPYDHASMLLLDEGSEATEPYNKHANLFENIS